MMQVDKLQYKAVLAKLAEESHRNVKKYSRDGISRMVHLDGLTYIWELYGDSLAIHCITVLPLHKMALAEKRARESALTQSSFEIEVRDCFGLLVVRLSRYEPASCDGDSLISQVTTRMGQFMDRLNS